MTRVKISPKKVVKIYPREMLVHGKTSVNEIDDLREYYVQKKKKIKKRQELAKRVRV